MYNNATTKAIERMKDLDVTIGTIRAAELLGISPRGFRRYLEKCETLPDYAIEVTDEGSRRTFRILTERFATFLSCGDPVLIDDEHEVVYVDEDGAMYPGF